jgi:hypothetical protein
MRHENTIEAPTPWSLGYYEDDTVESVSDANGEKIIFGCSLGASIQPIDFEQLVAVVNSHADLLAACEMAEELAGEASAIEADDDAAGRVEEILATFRAAIVKAKERGFTSHAEGER